MSGYWKFASFWTLTLCLNTAPTQAHSEELAGTYNLLGMMEMGANLVLNKDHTFVAEAYYGSAHGFAKGDWYLEDGIVRIESEPDLRPARRLEYQYLKTWSASELEEKARRDRTFTDTDWRDNYLLELDFLTQRNPPRALPDTLHFEFTDGSEASVPLSDGDVNRAVYPYTSDKVLRKISATTEQTPVPIQWLDVSPESRKFSVYWKKQKNQPITLTEAEQLTSDEAGEAVDSQYSFALHHYDPLPIPAIEPVDIYWQFQDDSIQHTLWSDPTQPRLTVPYDAKRELVKIGMRRAGSGDEIEWQDLTPQSRWISLLWAPYPNPANGDLAVIFQDLQLEIEPGCLIMTFAFGTQKGCFRRQL
jgi:hypothetical protein